MATPEDSIKALKARFVGKSLAEVPTPSAILDLAKVETNCSRMLDAVTRLGFGWRAHIKSHKTTELTRLQLSSTGPAHIIVSTLLEAERILPLMQEYKSQNRDVSILYSFPLYASAIPRLAPILSTLGPGSVAVMVDNPAQIPLLSSLKSQAGHAPSVFVKIDMGTHRAGVVGGTDACKALLEDVRKAEGEGSAELLGLYCHAGHSYDARSVGEAEGYFAKEFGALAEVVGELPVGGREGRRLKLSVGATPTATTLQNEGVLGESDHASGLGGLLAGLREKFDLEVHAGVYPLLDLQQLSTRARPSALLSSSNIAITILAEVASYYPGRGANGTDEALVNSGSLALGREPCKDLGSVKGKDYTGWGVVSPWRAASVGVEKDGDEKKEKALPEGFPREYEGWWLVGRISQEHGVLTWSGGEDATGLKVGDRVRIWPNHACIAGAGHEYYLVVDSRGNGDEVVDVWPRWNGW